MGKRQEPITGTRSTLFSRANLQTLSRGRRQIPAGDADEAG